MIALQLSWDMGLAYYASSLIMPRLRGAIKISELLADVLGEVPSDTSRRVQKVMNQPKLSLNDPAVTMVTVVVNQFIMLVN